MNLADGKRLNGQYFTAFNPFQHPAFFEFIKIANLPDATILEPFAGSNNLVKMLEEMGFAKKSVSFDIVPKDKHVQKRDTLADFPVGFDVCITNPPYLAKNSAIRRGMSFLGDKYDDLYKFALEKCLLNCAFVAAIIPASFLHSKLFRERLYAYILLNVQMFKETTHPVCLALFAPKPIETLVYDGWELVGNLSEIEKKIPSAKKTFKMKFNDPNGVLGLLGVDNIKEPSIRFCYGSEINSDNIFCSSRNITRIEIKTDKLDKLVQNLNERLHHLRKETADMILAPCRGLRKDGRYRRRLHYYLARNLINHAMSEL